MSPCSRKAREYGLKLLFLKTEVEKSGYTIFYVRKADKEPGFLSETQNVRHVISNDGGVRGV